MNIFAEICCVLSPYWLHGSATSDSIVIVFRFDFICQHLLGYFLDAFSDRFVQHRLFVDGRGCRVHVLSR